MKRIISILVILLMITTVMFTGCKKETAPAGPVSITVEVYDRGSDGGRSLAYDNVWTTWIHDKVLADLNIDITFTPVGRWSENTDIVNLMASASAPDLCYTYNGDMITQFSAQGGILDLAPYVDRLLPDMKKLMGADPAIPGKDLIYRNIDPSTGKLYSLPNYVVNVPVRNTFIRKDWLDKLGLPLPKTTQEFHDALVAFRDKDPGGVGRNRVVPFGQNEDARWGFQDIIYSFFDKNISERDFWIQGFGQRSLTMPGYKDAIRLLNQWYNEGLIYRDFPLMKTADDFYNMMKSGVMGAMTQNWDLPYRTDYKINEELAKNVPGAEFVPVDCFQSADGITHKSISDRVGMRIFVPAFSKNPEAALRYLNWLCKYENFHYLQLGDVGVNHELVNGIPRSLGRPAGDPWFQNSQYNIDYTMPINGIEMLNTEMNASVLALGYGNVPVPTIVNAYNLSIANGRVSPVYQAVVTKQGVYAQTLNDKADALIAQAVMARPADFDRIWDAGIRDFLASGYQEILDEKASLWK